MRKFPVIVCVIFMTTLFATCGNEGGYYYFPEYFAEYLELSETQRAEVLPKLEDIQKDVITYFREWMPVLRERERSPIISSDSSLDSAKTAVWQVMRDKGASIMPLLTPPQQDKFSRVSLPNLELRELLRTQRAKELMTSKELKGMRTISAAAETGAAPIDRAALRELQDSRTISIGFQRMSGSRVGKVSRGFPLFIQATLIDPALANAETAINGDSAVSAYLPQDTQKLFSVNLSISTNYHESYVDLKRWIVFLETEHGLKIEPDRIIKQTQSYHSEAPDPFRNIFIGDDFLAMSEIPASTSVQPAIGAERGVPGLSIQKGFYTLQFPRHIEGSDLIGGMRGELKLVLLDEINGDERAEGSWKFE